METHAGKIVTGFKHKKISGKIIKYSDEEYIVEEKRYLLGFAVRVKHHQYNNYNSAEDKLIELKDMPTIG